MSKKKTKARLKRIEKGVGALLKQQIQLEADFIRDHDGIWDRLDQDKRALHTLKQRVEVLGVHLLHLRKWSETQGYQRIFEFTAARAQADAAERLDTLQAQVGRREVVETRDEADRSDDAPEITPGACGDPMCPVLHADPANPIHPPFYIDSRTPHRYTADMTTPVHGPCSICGVVFIDHPRYNPEGLQPVQPANRQSVDLGSESPVDSSSSISVQRYTTEDGLWEIIPRVLWNFQDVVLKRGAFGSYALHHVECNLPPGTAGLPHSGPCARRVSSTDEDGDTSSDGGGTPEDPLGDGGCANMECLLDTNHPGKCEFPDRSPISHGFEDPRHNQRPWSATDVDPGKVEGGKVW